MRYSFIFIIVYLCIAVSTAAQVESTIKNPAEPLPVKNDTSRIASDTLINQADTLSTQADSVKTPKGDIETTINYTARDSIRASVNGKLIWLYGEAKIIYGEIELEAEEITIDYANNTIAASGKRDSLGNRIGYPIFKNGAELYETKGIVYNFKTGRAKISEVVTQQGEGFLHSNTAFKNEKNEILSIHNSYTTCNLEHPHFRIQATKTKAIPNDKIVAGPFYFEFNDIPLPIGFLFGMFPSQRQSKSGIIVPSYGEERRRGFNLRGGGYFFDISDYIKLAVTGDMYSKGGHALYANSNYIKRYAYSGNFNFSYSKNRLGERIEDRDVSNDFRLTWSHSPQGKGSGRFAASVNAATATFNKNNNLIYTGNPQQLYNSQLSNISTKLSSNVSYNKRFVGTPFSMGLNLSHNQDLVSRLVDLPLPNLTLNMTNIYPFQKKGKTGPLDNFSLGYSMSGTNRITNNLGRLSPTATRDSIAPFNLENLPLFIKNGRKGIRHSVPISFSFKALKYFTVTPSINYEEQWYFEKLKWDPNAAITDAPDTLHQFNRIANYSFSTGFNTRIYGMYFFKRKDSKIKAIRHVINPSISFGFTPDFTKNRNYFTEFNNTALKQKSYRSRHEGSVYGGSGFGRAGSIGFSIGNNLEAKIKSLKDTAERKIMLLNNLSISSTYNLMADSFKLAPFGLAANTSILENKINVNLSATLDPYNYKSTLNDETKVVTETREKSYAWKAGKIGRITNATLALTTNLNPEKRNKENTSREKIGKSNMPEQEKQYLLQNPQAYIDFDIPWSLNLGYNASYSHNVNQKSSIIQTLQMSGDFSLSEKWKTTYSSGYDFEAREFTQTSLGISRDLHCWTMNLNWVPFGRFQSFNFTIAVKASVLQDLKIERRKPFLDNL